MYTEEKGILGELFAALILLCKGFWILKRRYKTKCGEIDIIAKKGDLITFIEVKFRQDLESGYMAISNKQLKRIQRASEIFLDHYPEYRKNFRRYDIVLIYKWKIPVYIENISFDRHI